MELITTERTAAFKRVLAYVLDLAVVYLYIILLFLVSTAVNEVLPFHEAMGASYVLRHLISFTTLTLPMVLYFIVMERSRWQGTAGKKVLKLRVVAEDGSRASLKALAVRNGLKFLPWEVAHTHIHLNPEYLFTGQTTPAGWALGVALPLVLVLVYLGMIFFRTDGRSLYELASHTGVVRSVEA